MPIDTSMYGSLQQANPMQTFGNMVGISNAMEQNKALKNQNVAGAIDAEETKKMQPILREVQNYTDERGNIDFNKLVPLVMQNAPKNGASIINNMSQAQQQRTAAQNAIGTQSASALQRASQAIFGMDPDKVTPEILGQTAAALNKNFTDPNSQAATDQVIGNLVKVVENTKPGDPLRKTLFSHAAMMFQPIEAQQSINTPNAIGMGNGQQTWLQNTKPGVQGIPQNSVLPNSAVQQQLGPNTPVMQGNTPGYIGPQIGGVAPNGQKQQSGFVAAGLPEGTKANINDNFTEMNRHFGSLQDSASGSQLVQGLTGNIKSLAKKAITGTLGDKQAYVNGLLAQFKIPGTGDLKTDTDTLEKNLAQLNMATPATTDAMRDLIAAGRPGSKMSEEALIKAADQVASQIQANVAVRNHLSGYKFSNGGQGDAVSYQQERQNIEKVADPRLWQYKNLQPGSKEAKDFMENLTLADKKELIEKSKKAQKMGLL